MPLLRSGTVPILTLALIVAAAAAACAPTANGLPTANALPTALAGASGAAPSAAAVDSSGELPSGAVPSGAVPSGASTDPAAAWPAFAACLRAHGANVADPVIDKNGDPQWAGEIKQFMTQPVRDACQPIIAGLEGQKDGRNRPAFTLESELAFAACIREHGFPTWPDPVSTADAGRMPEGFDKQDPAVFAALEACNSVLVEVTASPSAGL